MAYVEPQQIGNGGCFEVKLVALKDKEGNRAENLQHCGRRSTNGRLVSHPKPLVGTWKDPTISTSPLRRQPHSLALDGCGHSEGSQSEGGSETRPEGGNQMKAAIYARVSTTNHGQDVTLQTRELRQFVGARGWDIAGEYVDAGVSGTKDSRPELNRLIADAHKRRFDVVCVWRFDRFARSVSHLLRALETFKALGIDFVSFSEQMDTSTPAGKMVFTVLGAVAELERSLIVERVRAGLRNARAKGKTLGRPRITVDAARISRLRAEGKSWQMIASELGVSVGTAYQTSHPFKNPSKTHVRN
jgi:DNA invertase Pin-like site-specific DNA recombinase